MSSTGHIDNAPLDFDGLIEVFGSQKALALALGVSEGRVSQWRSEGLIPVERCIEIEAATRHLARMRGDPTLIRPCEELRPDVAWYVIRDNPLPPIGRQLQVSST